MVTKKTLIVITADLILIAMYCDSKVNQKDLGLVLANFGQKSPWINITTGIKKREFLTLSFNVIFGSCIGEKFDDNFDIIAT